MAVSVILGPFGYGERWQLLDARRLVTVLFCDVVGSTELSRQVDAEDWAEIISVAFPLMIEPVERYGGTVARLLGDAILAFFGAPTAHEDDPQRAILAALEILNGITAYRKEVQAEYGLDFNVRIGINTGLVVTGVFGTQGASEYTAMGEEVNLAARMQQTAPPGTIQVAANTYELARGDFEFAPLGPIEVKGLEFPVDAYRVLGQSTGPEPLRAGSPLVGRERQLDLLRCKIEELRNGRGGIIALVGEAGLGKSRLLAQMRDEWTGQSSNALDSWIEDRLVSFEASVPYGLFRRRLAASLDLSDRPGESTIRERVLGLIGPTNASDSERAVHAVAQLFLTDRLANGPGDMRGEGGAEDFRLELAHVSERAIASWIERVERGVYVIDDFHCIDPASADLLEQLMPALYQLPLLVVLALRPERGSSGWALHEHLSTSKGAGYLTITLTPLDGERSALLIEALLPGANFPREFQEMILERVGGNPLFAEEIVRSLREQGVIQQVTLESDATGWQVMPDADLASVRIPPTLHALIQDRTDRLDPEAQKALQLAAVIGRQFGSEELAEIADHPDKLPEQLAALERAMLIHEVYGPQSGRYEFHHALTWEAVYRSILRRNRRPLHRRVAEALERLHAGNTSAIAGLLAYHFTEAGGDPRALPYAIAAGDHAFTLFAPSEAIEHYSRAIDVAGRNATDAAPTVYHRRGRSYLTLGDFDRARQDFEKSLELARAAEDERSEWQALTDLADLWEGLDYHRSGEWRRRALAKAEATGDSALVGDSLARIGNWYTNVEELDQARAAMTRALTIFEQQGDLANKANALDLLGTLEDIAGDAVKMLAYWREAAALFETLGDRLRLSSVFAGIPVARGFHIFETIVVPTDLTLKETDGSAERALEIARSIGWKAGEAYALLSLSLIKLSRGQVEEALEAAELGLAIARQIQHREWIALGHCASALARAAMLSEHGVIDNLVSALETARESGSGHFTFTSGGLLICAQVERDMLDRASELLVELDPDGPARTVGRRLVRLGRAEHALATGKPGTALEIVDYLYDSAYNLTRPADIPRLALLRGRALAQFGRHDEAMSSLDEALHGAEVRELFPLMWRIRVERGRLLASSSSAARAATEFDLARAIVQQIAGEIKDGELRANFLSRANRFIQTAQNLAGPHGR